MLPEPTVPMTHTKTHGPAHKHLVSAYNTLERRTMLYLMKRHTTYQMCDFGYVTIAFLTSMSLSLVGITIFNSS